MRRWETGDTPRKLSKRLGIPERRIFDALIEPLGTFYANFERGSTADDIAKATELPRPFVVYAMRREFGKVHIPRSEPKTVMPRRPPRMRGAEPHRLTLDEMAIRAEREFTIAQLLK
ncbi:MAG: hypothetical protein WEA10_07905 [Actinomycetota bacterium]